MSKFWVGLAGLGLGFVKREEGTKEKRENGRERMRETGLNALLYKLLDRVAPYPVHSPIILSVSLIRIHQICGVWVL